MVRAANNMLSFFSAQVPVSPGRTVCLTKEKRNWKAHPNAERLKQKFLNARRLFVVDKP